MLDYDYDNVWEFENSCHDYLEDLDESYEYQDDDLNYERSDSTDYQQLSYIHYS